MRYKVLRTSALGAARMGVKRRPDIPADEVRDVRTHRDSIFGPAVGESAMNVASEHPQAPSRPCTALAISKASRLR